MTGKLFILFIVFFTQSITAQTFVLSGKITNKKEALPFATIIVKGTSYAVNSNIDGQYTLRLPAGNHEITFEYIGFAKKTEKVNLKGDQILDVDLVPEGISLKEVVIEA